MATTSATTLKQSLLAIVGDGGMMTDLPEGLSRILPSPHDVCGVIPQSVEELAAILAAAGENRWRVLPSGRGSKLDWGGLARGADVLVSTARLNRLIDHAVGDLTITVEAGMGFSEVQSILAKAGQFLAIDPTYPNHATIGGIIATGDAGSLRQRYGGVRDMLLGISFVRADGAIVKAGGRVVKNVAGYDLMKLFTGSYGTLGILTQATFRVYPIPETSQTLVMAGEPETIARATQTLLSSALTPTCVDLLSSRLVSQLQLGSGMGLAIRFQSIAPGVTAQVQRSQELAQALNLKVRSLAEADEVALWQKLKETIQPAPLGETVTCKIGVRSTEAISTLVEMESLIPAPLLATVHAGSGLGSLCFPEGGVRSVGLAQLRSRLQERGGFLTLLQGSIALKQQVDAWGYNGNALELMRNLKHQFDPLNILNPGRFVGGI